jgi:hypothetical protein
MKRTVTLRVSIMERRSGEMNMKTHQFGKHALFATVIVVGLASVPIAHAAPVSYSPRLASPLAGSIGEKGLSIECRGR